MATWAIAFIGSSMGGFIAYLLAVRSIERAAIPHIEARFAEMRRELDTLRKTQQVESEWHGLARELAEIDGREASD